MKTKATKLLALLLAGLMLTATLAACGEPDEGTVDTAAGTNGTVADESQTVNEAQSALDAIGAIDYGGGTLGVLYCGAFKNEVYATSEFEGGDDGNSQVINEAVYKRNTLLEETCKLTLEFVEKDAAAMGMRSATRPRLRPVTSTSLTHITAMPRPRMRPPTTSMTCSTSALSSRAPGGTAARLTSFWPAACTSCRARSISWTIT